MKKSKNRKKKTKNEKKKKGAQTRAKQGDKYPLHSVFSVCKQ